ncbi:hypothetical protein V6N13_095266 [Hibiscus sabdariffa]
MRLPFHPGGAECKWYSYWYSSWTTNELQSAYSVLTNASLMQSDFGLAIARVARVPVFRQPLRWTCPPVHTIKINVDYTFSRATGIATIGGVARDHDGFVLAGFAAKLKGTHPAKIVEAKAFHTGLQLAIGGLQW